MIASWPQVALRGSSCLANASACAPVCSTRNVRNRRLSRVNPQQRVEAARLQEAAPELRPSTLPEAWERSSLSDEGIREALRARTKHYASQEETQQEDSSSISPESDPEQQDFERVSQQPTQRQRKKAKPTAAPSTKSSRGQAADESRLSERQRRRRRVGWALHQRRAGKQVKSSAAKSGAKREPKEAAATEKFTPELEVRLCSQIQEAQRLRQVFVEAAGDRDQLSQREWAQAAGLGAVDALQAALQAGSAAERRLVSEHKGFLMSLVNKYAHQGLSQEELFVEAKTALIRVAEKFDVGKKTRLTSFAWFDVTAALQALCRNEGALLPLPASAMWDITRLDAAKSALSQQTGRNPTLEEVAKRAGVTPERARLLRERQRTVAYESIGLSMKNGKERGADELLLPVLNSGEIDSENPDAAICEREKAVHMRAIVNLALDALACTDTGRKKGVQYNQRIVKAMRLRYGLDDGRACTLSEVSEAINVSKETARQLIEEGKERLAHILAQEDLLRELQPAA